MQQNFVRKEFFFHTAKYGPDFFFQLGAGQILFGQNQSEKFCSTPLWKWIGQCLRRCGYWYILLL